MEANNRLPFLCLTCLIVMKSSLLFANIGAFNMTEQQAEHIQNLRNKGFGYLIIAKALSLSINTVKTFCRRHDLCSDKIVSADKPVAYTGPAFCRNCGKTIYQAPGRKHRKFCSNTCRVKWWNSHLDCVNKRAIYMKVCAYCGTSFTSYGNRKRKYCSHDHYIKNRYRSKGCLHVEEGAI